MPGRLVTFPRSASSYSADPSPLFHYPLPSTPQRQSKRVADVSNTSTMDSIKRHSLAALGKGKDKESRSSPESSSRLSRTANYLDIGIESPPAIFYGNASHSTGALYAGQLRLTVVEPQITLHTFTMTLSATITARKPVAKDCAECGSIITELKKWTILSQPKTYAEGVHSIPFSYLIPGHLPITTHGELGRIQYYLDAKAVTAPKTTGADTITLRREVPISRAVKPLEEKTSLRIFPPTNLTARVSHYPIIHPIGEFNVKMQVSGIMDKQKDTQTRWRLRKVMWRLEETEKMISPACKRHAAKVGGEGKGIAHEDTRTIGRDEMKAGWKTDLSEGTIELEFAARPSGNPMPLCDVESPTGLSVTHSLVIELIIAEEWAPNKTPEKATPTGAARVLRMQFQLMITERSGMGISWDEEQPPMYEDVPASPPMYPVDRNAPPSYPGGIAEPETMEMQRTRSELLNYTGTPLGSPPPLEEEIEAFEGLTLGPSMGRPGPSRSRSRDVRSGPSRPRGLGADDFDTDRTP